MHVVFQHSVIILNYRSYTKNTRNRRKLVSDQIRLDTLTPSRENVVNHIRRFGISKRYINSLTKRYSFSLSLDYRNK